MNAPTASYVSSTSTLCAPASVYFVISFVALLFTWVQNRQNSNVYCVGSVSCPVQNTTYVFILKILWFLFWTWILNVLCTKGYTTIAWVLVAIPFMVFFTLMFGLANAMASGSKSTPASSPVSASNASYTVGISGTTAYNGKASKQLNTNTNASANANLGPGQYAYGNKADKIGVYPNETNTQYSSYSSYDANLDNRAEYLDRESKGLVRQQSQDQPQQQQQQQPQPQQ